MLAKRFICLLIIFSACISERALILPEGKLEFDITGKFISVEKSNSWQGPVQYVAVEIEQKAGQYSGIIERRIVHIQRDQTTMVEYKAKLYGARHSQNEIVFRDEILVSCGAILKDNVQTPIVDLKRSDFRGKNCRTKEDLADYHLREESEKYGSVYFSIKNNSEIWWTPREDLSAVKLRRESAASKTTAEDPEKIFP